MAEDAAGDRRGGGGVSVREEAVGVCTGCRSLPLRSGMCGVYHDADGSFVSCLSNEALVGFPI